MKGTELDEQGTELDVQGTELAVQGRELDESIRAALAVPDGVGVIVGCIV